MRGGTVRPWVPWMSGQWNPYEACDVQLLSVQQGNQEEIWPYDNTVCPTCYEPQSQFRTSYMYNINGAASTCNGENGQYVTSVDVLPSAVTNLCYVTMSNSDPVCANAQGMVGGNRGQSVLNHPRVPTLYGTDNVSWPTGGIFPRSDNHLFADAISPTGEYGILAIPGDEIGAVGLGLAVDPVPGSIAYLHVRKVPLQAQSGFMPTWASQDVEDWIPGLQAAFTQEDALHQAEQQNRGNTAWDCPVRRVAFYSGSIPNSDFASAIPSPGRARRVVGAVTNDLSTQPTQVLQRDSSSLGSYTTGNGFCYCPSGLQSKQDQCLIPVANTLHNCALSRTIQALQGQWTQSYYGTPLRPWRPTTPPRPPARCCSTGRTSTGPCATAHPSRRTTPWPRIS